MCRSRYVHHLAGTKSLMDRLNLQFLKFLKSSLDSYNPIVRQYAIRSLYSPNGFFKNRLNDCIFYYRDCVRLGTLTHIIAAVRNFATDDYMNPPPEVVVIMDLIKVRNGTFKLEGFDSNTVDEILYRCQVT